ncbi:acyltransferase family protein [Pseudodesulfovibrio cashew]|uniref:Acyltransferase family protein n=1 Tax=Pseudodesulfovibrio cashew TaxID=2678688 RepID=A0A6I6JFN6_9BACT|nr:acyltransferase family protein [Pseudodesulfovibrio cashew]QGY39890.1 acyltransferase family protein [Pseudodesulfovibrio cashew]
MQTERVIFLDVVRTVVVLFVVILHAACSYAEIIPWWSVQEFPKEPAYTLIILFFDLFCMPALFLLAGYFAPESMRRHGTMGFIKAKFRRLGIPFLLLALLFVPVISYIGFIGQTHSEQGFLHFWIFQLTTAWKPILLLLDSAKTAIPHAFDFSQWHLWFISLLLIFFLLYAALRNALPGLFRSLDKLETGPGRILLYMFLACAISALSDAAINLAVPDWAWAKIGGYLMFQPTRLGLYLTFFLLGVVANHTGWFRSTAIPNPLWLWLMAALALDVAFLAWSRTFIQLTGPAPLSLGLLHATLRAFAAMAWTGVLIKAALRWGNSPGPLKSSLSRSSYDIYLLHLPIVVGLQLLVVTWPVGLFVKFLFVSVAAILVCWQLSRRLVGPHPAIALSALGAYFLALCAAA